MADNVAITAGSGTTIAADDVGSGVLHQRVKVTWGPDGTGNDADVASGKPLPIQVRGSTGTEILGTSTLLGQGTAAASIKAVLPSDRMNSQSFKVAMTTDTSAYASGDLIADTQQLDAFFNKSDGSGVINSITIVDKDAQGVACYIFFHVTSTSMGTENSAPNISDANAAAGIQGMVAVATSDFVTVSGTKVATIRNIGIPVKAVSGTDDLYVSVLNATGTPTYAGGTLDLTIGAMLD